MRTKIVFSTLLAAIFLATQIIAVGAAPVGQDTTPITGTVVSVTVLDPDPETGEITVEVVLSDELGGTQTISLSVEAAISLGLVTDDGTGNPIADETVIGTAVEIDPATVIGEDEEKEHPVGSALSDFFSDLLGVDYEMVMGYHDDEGVGFGVIAQALWMTNSLEGDTEIFSAILEAKQSKDFEATGFTNEDGSIPQNWGQFRKAVSAAASDGDDSKKKAKENLGAIMSGHADNGQNETQSEVDVTEVTDETSVLENEGNDPKDNGKDKSNYGNSKDKDKGKSKDKDKDKNKGNNK